MSKKFYGMNSIVNTKRFIQAFKSPEKVQKKTLMRILKKNQFTFYGNRYGFGGIDSIEVYQQQVPVIEYGDIIPEIERLKAGEQQVLTQEPVKYFASTSGTTSGIKLIPVTKQRISSLNTELLLWMRLALKGHMKQVLGKILYIAGPYFEGTTSGGIPYGSISGYLMYKGPEWAKKRLAIPIEVFNEMDYDRKIHAMAFHALQQNVTHLGFTTPIEVLLLFDYIKENWESLLDEIGAVNPRRAKRLRQLDEPVPSRIWPKLHMANCFMTETSKIYMQTLIDVIGRDIVIRDPGINASEGRISLGICNDNVSGYPAVYNTFFEFEDCETPGKISLIHELVKGKRYRIIITTSEGLYRYQTGDIVEITGIQGRLPKLRFYQRDFFLNVVGELAYEPELVRAVEHVLEELKISVNGFTFIPWYPNLQGDAEAEGKTKTDEDTRKTANERRNQELKWSEHYGKPRYELLVELGSEQDPDVLDVSEFAWSLDAYLQQTINDYKQMRCEFARLDAPIVSVLQPGSWSHFNKHRIVQSGQPKYIHIARDPEFRDNFTIIRSSSV